MPMTEAEVTYCGRLKKTFNDSESMRKVSVTNAQLTHAVRSLFTHLTTNTVWTYNNYTAINTAWRSAMESQSQHQRSSIVQSASVDGLTTDEATESCSSVGEVLQVLLSASDSAGRPTGRASSLWQPPSIIHGSSLLGNLTQHRVTADKNARTDWAKVFVHLNTK